MTTQVTTIDVDKLRNGILFSLTVRKPGVRVKVKDMAALESYLAALHAAGEDPVNAAVDAPRRMSSNGNGTVKITKRILLPKPVTKEDEEADPYEATTSFLNGIKEKLCGRFGRALPSKIKEGLFIVRKDLVESFEEDLKAALNKLESTYIPAVRDDYEASKARAKETPVKQGGLGPLYREADYPTAEEFCGMFGLEWQYLQLGIPADLPEALRAEQAAKLERQFAEASEEITLALRESFQALITHATEKLSCKPGEKPPRFHDTLIGNIGQFCEVFESRNLLNDTALQNLVNQAKTVITGLDPDRLRTYANVREETRTKFEAIQKQLDTMLVSQKSRHFDLSDE